MTTLLVLYGQARVSAIDAQAAVPDGLLGLLFIAALRQNPEVGAPLVERDQRHKGVGELGGVATLFPIHTLPRSDDFLGSPGVVVNRGLGRTTTGIEPHIADLKQQFVFAPDTKIAIHPIKIAQGRKSWRTSTPPTNGAFNSATSNAPPGRPHGNVEPVTWILTDCSPARSPVPARSVIWCVPGSR